MSYEKVKSITIKNGEVLVTSKCNNDTEPVKQWNCTMLTEILKTEGLEAAELSIMEAFESGNFQCNNDNRYTRALRVLFENPTYASFDWRNSHFGADCPIQQARKTDAFKDLLKQALNTTVTKEKIIVSKDYFGKTVFLQRKTRSGVSWTDNKTDAKVFNYMADVKVLISSFTNGKDWNIETI